MLIIISRPSCSMNGYGSKLLTSFHYNMHYVPVAYSIPALHFFSCIVYFKLTVPVKLCNTNRKVNIGDSA